MSDPLAIFSSVGAWRMRPALSIDWHTLLEGDFVAHFVVHPNYQEDESMHRETLENPGSSPSAKKHMRIELATEAREGSTLKTKPSVLPFALFFHCYLLSNQECGNSSGSHLPRYSQSCTSQAKQHRTNDCQMRGTCETTTSKDCRPLSQPM